MCVLACHRQDIEVEMDRFEGGRQVALQKYKLIERPSARAEDSVNLAVDVMCTLCLGGCRGGYTAVMQGVQHLEDRSNNRRGSRHSIEV